MAVMTTGTGLLEESTVIGYLLGRGLTEAADGTARRLSGGVSNVVLRVDAPDLPGGAVVVKQAMGRLAVADEWYADRGRAHTEAVALGALTALTPGAVPLVLDDDPAVHALTITAAPPTWDTWKAQLMTGRTAVGVAARLGALLAYWHTATAAGGALPVSSAGVDGAQAFRELRIDPYFTVTAARLPALADEVLAVADDVVARRSCLVHGDFSPKNILVSPDGEDLWVIDLEVAHRGDPAFDVAFLVTHLLLKALHLPATRAALLAERDAFLTAYGQGPGVAHAGHLRRLVACLLLARVRGSSPVEYLTRAEQEHVLARASVLIHGDGAVGRGSDPW